MIFYAKTFMELLAENDATFTKRGLERVDIKNIQWYKNNKNLIAFHATGQESYSNKNGYIVAIKFSGKHLKLVTDQIKVACTCPAFHWWGVKYNATEELYNYKTFTHIPPDIRDKERNKKLCKHLVAVFNKIRGKSIKEFTKHKGNFLTLPSLKTIKSSVNDISEIDYTSDNVANALLDFSVNSGLEIDWDKFYSDGLYFENILELLLE